MTHDCFADIARQIISHWHTWFFLLGRKLKSLWSLETLLRGGPFVFLSFFLLLLVLKPSFGLKRRKKKEKKKKRREREREKPRTNAKILFGIGSRTSSRTVFWGGGEQQGGLSQAGPWIFTAAVLPVRATSTIQLLKISILLSFLYGLLKQRCNTVGRRAKRGDKTRRRAKRGEEAGRASANQHIRACESLLDWCCFCYFLRNSLVALLEALFARIFLDLKYRCAEFFFLQGLSLTKPLPPLLPTRLLCLVVAVPLVCWLYMCACVCVPLYVHVKMCR